MPYIILADKQRELDRRELSGRVVIGRASECDLTVRDAQLSRTHCAIDELGGHWVLIDLGSRNGTRVNDEAVTRHVLADGDVVQIGKTKVCFRDRAFVPPPPDVIAYSRTARPADPTEALAGTVAGFRYYDDAPAAAPDVIAKLPRPQPRPHEPRAYNDERGVQRMIADIAASDWDLASAVDSRTQRARAAVVERVRSARITVAPAPAQEIATDKETAPSAPALPQYVKRRMLLATCAWGAAVAIVWAWVISLPW